MEVDIFGQGHGLRLQLHKPFPVQEANCTKLLYLAAWLTK